MVILSTPYINIFNKYNAEVTDSNLFSSLTDEELTELLDIFLSKSKSIYFKNCTKDLTDVETYDYYTKTFTADGASNTFVIDDYPTDPNVDAILMVCSVNGTNIITYTFDENTLTFTITPKPALNDVVECGFDFSGQFNQTLDEQEEWILAKGMQMLWCDRQIYREEKLRDKIGTKDYAVHSPANLISKLIDLRNMTKRDLKEMTVSYSFDSFIGFN